MDFGIHTCRTHLDLIDSQVLADFKKWNNGKNPAFAGRNFLGGDFIWAPSEATNSKTSPSPKNLSALQVMFDRIAPIQAPQPSRQSATGKVGELYGKIDAATICKKIAKSIEAGEFKYSVNTCVWLHVDSKPSNPLSTDYWAGWAGVVNSTMLTESVGAIVFTACIICQYTFDQTTLIYSRDSNVNDALKEAQEKYKNLNTRCYAIWADATIPGPLTPGPDTTFFWEEFKEGELPDIWRYAESSELKHKDGSPLNLPNHIMVNVIRPRPQPEPGDDDLSNITDYMLEPDQWQPNGDKITNGGFIIADTEMTNSRLDCVKSKPIPRVRDRSGEYQIGPFTTNFIGRYLLRIGTDNNFEKTEAERISNAGINIFSIWQRKRSGGPNSDTPEYFQLRNDYTNILKGSIEYNNKLKQENGYLDGMEAFERSKLLAQPPQTPVYFAVDGAAGSAQPDRIKIYFEAAKLARDDFLQNNPDNYYLIGVYSGVVILELCYEQGITSYFWQGAGYRNNYPPGTSHQYAKDRFPWYHLHRWQYSHDRAGPWMDIRGDNWWRCAFKNTLFTRIVDGKERTFRTPNYNLVGGADPDADWGNGGTWNHSNPYAKELIEYRQWEKQWKEVLEFLKKNVEVRAKISKNFTGLIFTFRF